MATRPGIRSPDQEGLPPQAIQVAKAQDTLVSFAAIIHCLGGL